MIETELNQLSNEYKRSFIEDVLNNMSPLLDNIQLRELNRVLNQHTSTLDFGKSLVDTNVDYEVQNRILINQYIKSKKVEGLSERTIMYYESSLIKFSEWCIKSFINITHEDIREFLVFHQQLHNCTKRTSDNFRRILSAFYAWLEIEEYIMINPMRKIPKIKFEKRVKKAFTDNEIELMRDALENKDNKDKIRNQAIFEFFLSSGVRVGELVKLNVTDINFQQNNTLVLGKGNKERLVYFSEKTNHLLKKMLNGSNRKGALFIGRNKQRLGKSGVETMIRELGKSVGVEAHPHKFRRTFATNMVRKGMPINQVQQLLGHTSLEVTLEYVESDEDALQMIHRKFV